MLRGRSAGGDLVQGSFLEPDVHAATVLPKVRDVVTSPAKMRSILVDSFEAAGVVSPPLSAFSGWSPRISTNSVPRGSSLLEDPGTPRDAPVSA